MPSPFPGMDPYLENPARWPGFHNQLVADLRAILAPRVRPRYFVEMQERVYIAESPDVVGIPDAVVLHRRGEDRPNGVERTVTVPEPNGAWRTRPRRYRAGAGPRP